MRILVIGGTEFIGRRTVELLVERGDEVLVVHRGQTEPEPVLGTHLHADRSAFATLSGEIRAFRPDAVLDAMAMTAADVEAVLPHLPEVPIVLLSSIDVSLAYEILLARGPARVPVPFDEEAPLRANRYPHRAGTTPGERGHDYDKLDVEPAYLARGAAVLRLGMVYGARDPQRREEFVLRRVRAGRTRIPVGPATLLLPRLYIDDAASSVLAALDRFDRASGQVFHVNEQATYPVGAWMRAILAVAGHEAELVRVPDDLLPADLALTGGIEQHLLASSAKATGLLGWHPTGLDEAIARSVRWHLANPPADPNTDLTADDEALAAAR
jgi:nucleoside-diphosphate-sugar epimerase